MGFGDRTGDPLADLILIRIEEWSGQSFLEIREECQRQNKQDGRYTKQLREKIARVRWVIEGMDGYEQIANGTPTAFGHRLAGERGLDLPWDERQKIKDLVWAYLCIDREKDKDSVGASIWKGFVFHTFWASHRH